MVGIVQEQHPARALLFMQWKGMDWPVMVDALDLLEVTHVPITLLMDEQGIVRGRVPPSADPSAALAEFLTLPAGEESGPFRSRDPSSSAGPSNDAALAVVSRDPKALDDAVTRYEEEAAERPGDPWAHFRLGVVLRARHESPGRQPDDFQRASARWTRALELAPNNYIFRRRIQQYGPLPDKPYPFYDWIAQARSAIRERGGTPVELATEPVGSELAGRAPEPLRRADQEPPDPEGRILRDPGELVRLTPAAVPARIPAGGAARIHIDLRPTGTAHWNNAAGESVIWLRASAGCALDRRRVSLEGPRSEISSEARRVELDVRCEAPPSADGGAPVRGYALYYVCRSDDGPCLYRRQDFSVDLEVGSANSGGGG
jgi:hypothetical protein